MFKLQATVLKFGNFLGKLKLETNAGNPPG